MKLIAVMNVFNEEFTIGKSIGSIIDHVDEVHVFDGAYKQFPHEHPWSTDRTKEICKSFGKKVRFHECTEPWETQMLKRSKMFIGEPGDYYFKLDGDEYVANPELIRKYLTGDTGFVWCHSNLYSRPYVVARIHKHHDGMHYAGRHHWLFDGDDRFLTSDQQVNTDRDNVTTPIRIYNLRSNGRWKKKRNFLKVRNVDELSYRDENAVYGTNVPLMRHPFAAERPNRSATVVPAKENPKHSFVLTFSRPWATDRYFQRLNQLWIPENTEAICLVDHTDRWFISRVEQGLKESGHFDGITMLPTFHHPLPEFARAAERRARIAENWLKVMNEVRGEVVLYSEDDSIPVDPYTYQKLLERLDDPEVDFVQANIVSRWKDRLCPAWQVDEHAGAPVRVSSALPSKGMQPIQGVGWYCFAAKAETLQAVYPHRDGVMPLGPDLRFGWALHKLGYKLFHDWDLPIEHITETESIIPAEQHEQGKIQLRHWIKNGNDWAIDPMGE